MLGSSSGGRRKRRGRSGRVEGDEVEVDVRKSYKRFLIY